jgi:hypothetical protein
LQNTKKGQGFAKRIAVSVLLLTTSIIIPFLCLVLCCSLINTGLKSPPYCHQWAGISCNSLNQVSDLFLAGLSLPPQANQPTFPQLLQYLQQLPALQFLDLHSTSGLHEPGASIPPEIASLANLQRLDLSAAGFTGQLPRSVSAIANLQHLNASFNALAGSLPKVFAGMSSLVTLDLSGCGLAGPLPGSFAALQGLQELRLAGNALSGSLPETYALLSSLTLLDVSSNNLSGSLSSLLGGSSGKAVARMIGAAVAEAHTELQAARRILTELTARANKHNAQVTPINKADLGAEIRAAKLALQAATRAVESLKQHARSAAAAGAAGAAEELSVQVQGRSGLGRLQVLNAGGNALTGLLPKSLAGLEQLRVRR